MTAYFFEDHMMNEEKQVGSFTEIFKKGFDEARTRFRQYPDNIEQHKYSQSIEMTGKAPV